MVVRKIGVMSLAKMLGAIYGAVGLLFGGILSLVAVVGGAAAIQQEGGEAGPLLGLLIGAGAILFMPLFYGLLGFLGGALAAVLYNIFAGITGGIELQF